MRTIEEWNAGGKGRLPGMFRIEMIEVEPERVLCRMEISPEFLAPNGYLHAGTVVAFADTACGYGTLASVMDNGGSFTTLELKTNFIATVREGAIRCEATLAHAGRTTQVWDARVYDESRDKVIALFRCTQIILYKR